MDLLRAHGGAFLIGLAWIACSVGCVLLQYELQAVPLLWLPSAIAAAGLYSAPRDRTAGMIVALVLANLSLNFWFEMPLLASLSYTVANLAEALIVVAIARRVLQGRRLESLRMSQMFILFVAAFLGGLVSSMIVFSAGLQSGLIHTAWWVLSTSLGTSLGAPLLLYASGWLRARRGRIFSSLKNISVPFLLAEAGLFGLTYWTFTIPSVSLAPLVLSGMVFLVARYGQMAASVGILLYGFAATLHSLGGNTPAEYMDFPPFLAGLILQAYMLLMLATSFPLASLLMRHDRLGLRLQARNTRMRDNLLMLGLAEEVAGIGRWRYDPSTQKQDWSRQMFLINGLDPSNGPDPGDVKSLLPDRGEELFSQLAHHAKDHARYSFEYRICPPQGDERILKMYATNEFDAQGELLSMFGVVMDVTEHHQRQAALDRERTRAMRLAAEAQYLAHTDALTGLANRRRTITQLEKCVRRSEQGNRPLAVISFDIDHFKLVNDTRGHQTGDEVLMRIAEIGRSQARASDLVGRMGGEEFIWLLPGAGAGEARRAAERLRDAIEAGSSEGGLPQVTASIGYVLWRPGDDASTLLARVDDALYEAKAAGRNKVQEAA